MKGLLFQQVQVLSRQRSFQPGSYPSGHGGNEVAEAWGKEDGVRPSASRQAVTCVNTETAPKNTMRRPTLPGLGEEAAMDWAETDDKLNLLRRGGG